MTMFRLGTAALLSVRFLPEEEGVGGTTCASVLRSGHPLKPRRKYQSDMPGLAFKARWYLGVTAIGLNGFW